MKSHLYDEIESERTEQVKPERANRLDTANFSLQAFEEETKEQRRSEEAPRIDVPIRSFLRVVLAF
jgi:hypothetical protein